MAARVPEARYAYYRRCQIFRRNGTQCKAPAEKGSHICHAHAGQLAMAVRQERDRRAVLAEAVAEMRRRGKPECEMADLFTDFKGIQVTLAVMAQALIDGRIDCKTAGRLVVHLQTMSKLLWMVHREGRKGRKGNQIWPQICADERRLSKRTYHRGHKGAQTEKAGDGFLRMGARAESPYMHTEKTSAAIQDKGTGKALPRINTDATDRKKTLPLIASDDTDRKKPSTGQNWSVMSSVWCADQSAGARIFKLQATAFGDRSRAHGPPETKAA